MIRESFYRKIIQRLNGTLDGELFEECVADLLRTAYPSLVPIRGGSDFGMDGAIADGEGEPFPLVTTTSDDVIGNLTRNLESYIEGGGTRRKAIVATSQPLSPRKRNNLHKRAIELGFVLVQIHDQADIADRLYRDPKWCKELLNLTGDPAPLSAVPTSERPFVNLPLIGREADLVWISQTKGDRLVIGQPGSGKTFLLRKIAIENGGLFVKTNNRGEIAEAIREQQPRTLIVDDAQLRQELLLELKQLREEFDLSFAILASGWPGDEKALAEALNLPKAQVHHLGLLPRNDIVKIINATGIGGPNQLIRELVNQAEGRPGLAVTLADLCLKDDVEQVRLGDALSRSLLKSFASSIGERTTAILAAFSIGGDTGMQMQVVADELQLSLVELRGAVVKLAAGGVIFELDREHLAVRPSALRDALVRDVFFHGAASLPSERLLLQTPSIEQAALTLIGARWRGAVIPHDLIVNILEQANSDKVWREYASLGREETRWILTNHPEKLIAFAGIALLYLPETTIPLLLDKAIDDERRLNSTPEHPMRLLVDYVKSGVPGTGEPIRRRKATLDAACSWLKSGKDVKVGIAALTAAFSPRFEFTETDPGAGMSVNIRYGILTLNELQTIQELWSKALDALRQIEIDDWEPLRHLISDWAYPGQMGIALPDDMITSMHNVAIQLFRDVVATSNQSPEIAYWAKQMTERLHVDVEVHLDHDFEILYPGRDYKDWKETEERQGADVRKLAQEWSQITPEEVTKRINSLEEIAKRAKVRWPRWTPYLCEQIALQVTSPNTWAEVVAKTVKIGDLVFPFLQAAATSGQTGWVETAKFCLDEPELRWVGITVTLMQTYPPGELLDRSLKNLQAFDAQMVETLCIRNQVSESNLQKLLCHQETAIASATAIGEWTCKPSGTVRESLHNDWREAILRTTDDEFWLREILIKDPTLANSWLERRLAERSLSYGDEKNASAAVAVLDVNARINLLRLVPVTYEMEKLIADLVNGNPDVYRSLLIDERLKQFHLIPLGGHPEGIWIEKAKLALDAGYSVKVVADAAYSFPRFFVWSGNESNVWLEWKDQFDRLCRNDDERIRQVGEMGKTRAEASLKRALEEERREAIFGGY